MPHGKRLRGESGFYHVVNKGDGGQIIFENDGDRAHYLTCLSKALDAFRIELHAYCLMANHTHMLLRDEHDELGAFMKTLDESYARYFAKRTGRVGHVFRGRYWSEPVDTDEYFLAAMRYIHANPEPARICKLQEYPWSSYGAYVPSARPGQRQDSEGHLVAVNTDFALSMLGGSEAFAQFSSSGGAYARPFPKSKLHGHLSPDERTNIALGLIGRDALYGLKTMKPRERRPYLQQLAEAGFTSSEIARLTGFSQAAIHKALQKL